MCIASSNNRSINRWDVIRSDHTIWLDKRNTSKKNQFIVGQNEIEY